MSISDLVTYISQAFVRLSGSLDLPVCWSGFPGVVQNDRTTNHSWTRVLLGYEHSSLNPGYLIQPVHEIIQGPHQ
jgi:hypothetical protein